MVLVTVGSSNIQFDRLFKILDSLCEKGVLHGEDVIAQTGKLNYEISHYKHFPFISNEEMDRMQQSADFIICHAGTGTVTGAIKKGKKTIVFPRLKKYGEHESDHQLDLASQFAQEGYVLCAFDEEQLAEAVIGIDRFTPKKFISNTQNFCKMIESLL